jgi:hypothetical protein
MKQLAKDLQVVIIRFPQLSGGVKDMYQLCKDEIEEGGSYEHEIDSCRQAVRDLIEEIGEDSSFFY